MTAKLKTAKLMIILGVKETTSHLTFEHVNCHRHNKISVNFRMLLCTLHTNFQVS